MGPAVFYSPSHSVRAASEQGRSQCTWFFHPPCREAKRRDYYLEKLSVSVHSIGGFAAVGTRVARPRRFSKIPCVLPAAARAAAYANTARHSHGARRGEGRWVGFAFSASYGLHETCTILLDDSGTLFYVYSPLIGRKILEYYTSFQLVRTCPQPTKYRHTCSVGSRSKKLLGAALP